MRELSDTLLEAQKSSSRLPYVKVEVVGRVAGVARLDWSRLYTGSEGDCYHVATMPGDGSLVKARVDPASYLLYRQRVASPGPGSDFSSWIQVCSVSQASGVALASRGANVLLFYVLPNQQTICFRESTDYGATFGSETTLLLASGNVGWLAADIKPNGDVALFYSVGGTVYVIRRIVGSWTSPAAWSNSAASISGLATVYDGDWNLVLSGEESTAEFRVWTCVYGDGEARPSGVWSDLEELTIASADSDVEFRCPSIDVPDVFRTFFVEKYSGSESYSRPCWSHSLASADFISNLWREPVPFDLASDYGLAIAHFGSHAWLSTPFGVWRASLTPSSVEVSDDVVGLLAVADPDGGKVEVELRNDDGRYGGIGSGDYAAIREGSEVLVSPGYRTSQGVEVSTGPAYWIERWEYLSAPGSSRFILYAHDAWNLLARWKARHQFGCAQGEKSIFQLLTFVLARAGLELSVLSNSDTLTGHCPAFTIHPGENGATAVRRLLNMVPDVLFFRGHCGYVLNPQASDASCYSYGTEHQLWRGRYRSQALMSNRVQVYGSGVLSEGFDWEQVPRVYDRLRQVHDLNLDTVEEAAARAAAEMREQEILALGGEIAGPTNCGQELYDVVDITDQRAGLDEAKRRVMGLRLGYRPREGRYEQQILLGGV